MSVLVESKINTSSSFYSSMDYELSLLSVAADQLIEVLNIGFICHVVKFHDLSVLKSWESLKETLFLMIHININQDD